LPALLAALRECPDPLPIVWNCNGLLCAQAAELLDGLVATWVIDWKFGHPDCAARLAGVRGFDYAAEIERSFQIAERPVALAELPVLIVRHLLMPGHLECCTQPVLRELARRLPAGALVNLMTGFVPPDRERATRRCAGLREWNRPGEVVRAVELARELLGSRVVVDGR